ncbi:hypothetical protein [Clostridium sp. ZBS12]|nr:hypothetical protein [Clostridium sp. ZBS12]
MVKKIKKKFFFEGLVEGKEDIKKERKDVKKTSVKLTGIYK